MTDLRLTLDTSTLDRYLGLEEKLQILTKRLEQLEQEKGKTSEVVYLRVREDYEAQIAKLDEEVRPLRELALIVRNELQALLPGLQEIVVSDTYEKEELELRQSLGEFAEGEVSDQLAGLVEILDQHTAELAAAEKLNERFDAVFGKRELSELEPGDTVPEAAATPPVVYEPTIIAAPAESPAFGDATILLPVTATETVSFEGTKPLKLARLVPEDPPMGSQDEFYIGPLATIGRTAQNQVRLDDTSVSRTHAKIALTSEGYMIRDLDSQNGTFINGDRVTEQILHDGDRILVGTVSFRFHGPDGS